MNAKFMDTLSTVTMLLGMVLLIVMNTFVFEPMTLNILRALLASCLIICYVLLNKNQTTKSKGEES